MGDASKGARRDAPVKFGQLIAFKSSEEDCKGYVSAGGFVDNNIYVDILADGVELPPNKTDVSFSIVFRQNYAAHNNLRRALENMNFSHEDFATALKTCLDSNRKSEHEKLLKLKEREDSERVANERLKDHYHNTPVTYGTVVQIQHFVSEKYVSVLSASSQFEKKALGVHVTGQPDNMSWFKIMPGYRSTARENHPVHWGDPIVIESATMADHYINGVMLDADRENPKLGAWYSRNEVYNDYVRHPMNIHCIKGERKRLEVVGVSGLDEDQVADVIQGGDCVAIYHSEAGGYLVYENNHVYFKVNGSEEETPTNGYWRVEKTTVAGGAAHFVLNSEEVRIQHLSSGKYLRGMVNAFGSSALDVTDDYLDEGTTWTGEEYKNEKAVWRSNEYVFLKNTLTGLYLHERMVETNANLSGKGWARVKEWIRRRRYVKILCGDNIWRERRKTKKDRISEELGMLVSNRLATLNKVRSLKDLLMCREAAQGTWKALLSLRRTTLRLRSAYLNELEALEDGDLEGLIKLSTRESTTVIEVLSYLIRNTTESNNNDPYTREGIPIPSLQNMYREQGTIELMVDMLSLPFDKGLKLRYVDTYGERRFATLLDIGRLCYRFLKLACMQNPTNQLYVATWLPMFQKQMGTEMRSADLMTELFNGNLEVLGTVTEEEVELIIRLLRERKYPRFLHLLINTMHDGVYPNPRCQAYVANMLLTEYPAVLYDTRIERQRKVVKLFLRQKSIDKPIEKTPEMLEEKGLDDTYLLPCHPSPEEYYDWWCVNDISPNEELVLGENGMKVHSEGHRATYLCASLELLASMCIGRNPSAKEKLMGIKESQRVAFGYDELLAIVSESTIPFRVRRAHLLLLKALYIDCDPFNEEDAINYTRVWSFVDQKPKKPLTDLHENFTGMLKFLLSYLDNKNVVEVGMVGKNRFTCLVLDMVELLTKYGVLSSKEAEAGPAIGAKDFVEPVMNLLQVSSRATDSQFKEGEDTRDLVEAKCKAIDILNLFYDIQVNMRISTFFEAYEDIWKKTYPAILKTDDIDMPIVKQLKRKRVVSRPNTSRSQASILSQQTTRSVPASVKEDGEDRKLEMSGLTYSEATSSPNEVEPPVDLAKPEGVVIPSVPLEPIQPRLPAGLGDGIDPDESIVPQSEENEGKDGSSEGEEPVSEEDEEVSRPPPPSLPASPEPLVKEGGGGGAPKPPKLKFNDEKEAIDAPRALEPEKAGQDSTSSPRKPLKGVPNPSQFRADESFLRSLSSKLFEKPILHKEMIPQNTGPMVECLLNTTRYQNQNLVRRSLALLFRHVQQRAWFKSTVDNVHILVFPDAVRVYYAMTRHLAVLDTTVQYLSSSHPKVRQNAISKLKGSVDAIGEFFNAGKYPENILRKHQDIGRNMGVVGSIMRIAHVPLDVDENRSPTDEHHRRLLQICLNVLKELVLNNYSCQLEVFKSVGYLETLMGIQDLNVADTITGCVQDNPEILRLVADSTCNKFAALISKYGRNPRWLRFLDAIVVHEGKPVKERQTIVFNLALDDNVADFSGSTDTQSRLDLINEGDHLKEMGSRIAYHTTFIRLMGKCAMKNIGGGALVRSLLSCEDVISNVYQLHHAESSMQDGICMVKGAYLYAFTQVFLLLPDQNVDRLMRSKECGVLWKPLFLDKSLIMMLGEDIERFNQDMLDEAQSRPQLQRRAKYLVEDVAELIIAFMERFGHRINDLPDDTNVSEMLVSVAKAIGVLINNPLSTEVPFDDEGAQPLLSEEGSLSLSEAGRGIMNVCKGKTFIRVPYKKPPEVILPPDRANFKLCFPEFILQFCPFIGIGDVSRNIGVGMKNLSIIYGLPKNSLCFTRLATFTVTSPRLDSFLNEENTQLQLTGLRVARCAVYMACYNQPDVNFERFVNDEPPLYHSLKDLQVQQTRVASLGGLTMAMEMLQHPNNDIAIAALRLLGTLMYNAPDCVVKCIHAFLDKGAQRWWFEKMDQMLTLAGSDYGIRDSYITKRMVEKEDEVIRKVTKEASKDLYGEVLKEISLQTRTTPNRLIMRGNAINTIDILRHGCSGKESACLQKLFTQRYPQMNLLSSLLGLLNKAEQFLGRSFDMKDEFYWKVVDVGLDAIRALIKNKEVFNMKSLLDHGFLDLVVKVVQNINLFAHNDRTVLLAKISLVEKILAPFQEFLGGNPKKNVLDVLQAHPDLWLALFECTLALWEVTLKSSRDGGRIANLLDKTGKARVKSAAFDYTYMMKKFHLFEKNGADGDDLCCECLLPARARGCCIDHAFKRHKNIQGHLTKHIGYVELLHKGVLIGEYFRMPDRFVKLASTPFPKHFRNEIRKVPYQMQMKRFKLFFTKLEELTFDSFWFALLSRSRAAWYLLFASRSLFRGIAVGLVLVMNLLLVLTSKEHEYTIKMFIDMNSETTLSQYFQGEEYGSPVVLSMFYALGSIHLVLSLIYLCQWTIVEAPGRAYRIQSRRRTGPIERLLLIAFGCFTYPSIYMYKLTRWIVKACMRIYRGRQNRVSPEIPKAKLKPVGPSENEEEDQSWLFSEVKVLSVKQATTLEGWEMAMKVAANASRYIQDERVARYHVRYWLNPLHILRDRLLWFHIVYSLMSFVALVVTPFLYVYHLVDIVRNKYVQAILRGVTFKGKQLFWMVCLASVVLYIYAALGHTVLEEHEYLVEDTCDTFWRCAVNFFETGLARKSISTFLDDTTVSEDVGHYFETWGDHLARLWVTSFSIIFLFIVTTVLTGIVLSSITAQNTKLVEEEKYWNDHCYMCDQNKVKWEDQGASFNSHILNDHNPYFFIAYIFYLSKQNPENLSEQSRDILSKFVENNVEVMPISRSILLESAKRQNNAIKEEKYSSGMIMDTISQLENRFSSLETLLVDTMSDAKKKKKKDPVNMSSIAEMLLGKGGGN